MKYRNLIVTLIFLISSVSLATGKVCPKQKEDRDWCVIVGYHGNVEIYREELEFRVYSNSTQECDYGPNKFFYKEYPLPDTDLKAAIYAGWDKYRLAIYPADDLTSTHNISQAWFNRSPILESSSSLDGHKDSFRYFISCETVEHITK